MNEIFLLLTKQSHFLTQKISRLSLASAVFLASVPGLNLAAPPETPVAVTGKLEILIADDFTNHREELIYILEEAKSRKRFNLKFEGVPPDHLRSGMIVHARGRTNGLDLYLAADAGVEQSTEITTSSATVSGEQRTIVLTANFTDANILCSTASIRDLMFTDPGNNTVDDLFQETSRGQVSFAGDVIGPYNIDYSSTGACDTDGWANALDAEAMVSGVDLNNYTRKVYVLPSQNSCGFTGMGSVGGNPSRSWILRCDKGGIYTHELGHNLGMNHASTPTNQYGDSSDAMGVSGSSLRKINAPHQEQMGWVPTYQITEVTQSGTFDIAPVGIDPAQAVASQMLKIGKPDTSEYYYLSYRQPIGFDTNISQNYYNRLHVHRYKGDGSASRTFLLGTLQDGENYIDGVNGLTFTQVSHSDDYVTVQVEFEAVCTRNTPVISMTPADQSGLPGTTLDYLMTIANMDSAACPGSTFSLNDTLPGNWIGTFSSSSVTLLPGASDTATFSVTSDPNTSAGDHTVSVDVYDSLEAGHSTAASATYEVMAQCIPGVPVVSMTPSNNSGAAGATLDYTVTVTNTDDANCDQSSIELGPTLPDAWAGSFSPANLNLQPGATASAIFSVTSPQSATEGSYGLAVNISDASEPLHAGMKSAVYDVVSAADVEPPSAPGGLVGSLQRKQVKLTWSAASDNVGVAGYTVYRDNLVIGTATSASHVDSSVSSGSTHTYFVVAFDAAGNRSPASNTASITVSNGGKGGGKAGGGKKK